MATSKLLAAHLAGNADDVEAAFYAALQAGDVDKLMACWADEEEIVCIHPGSQRAVGAAAIRATFEAMFARGKVSAWPERVRKVETVGSCVHSVVERVEVRTAEGPRHAFVLATNVYLKTAQGWRLLAHHASPGTSGEPVDSADTPQVLH